MEKQISNSDETGSSSESRNSKISFFLMRKIVEKSTQCCILCTLAAAIRSEGHVLSPPCPPLSLHPSLCPSNSFSDSIFSKSHSDPTNEASTVLLHPFVPCAHPHYCTYSNLLKLLGHVSLQKSRLKKSSIYVLFSFASLGPNPLSCTSKGLNPGFPWWRGG